MQNYEHTATDRGKSNSSEAFSRHLNLRETLCAWCANNGDYLTGALSFDQVVDQLAGDRAALVAVRNFLSRGGEGWDKDIEVAQGTREKIAWAIIEKLTSR